MLITVFNSVTGKSVKINIEPDATAQDLMDKLKEHIEMPENPVLFTDRTNTLMKMPYDDPVNRWYDGGKDGQIYKIEGQYGISFRKVGKFSSRKKNESLNQEV